MTREEFYKILYKPKNEEQRAFDLEITEQLKYAFNKVDIGEETLQGFTENLFSR